mmetsp:Transcript_39034/g.54242  ORF Transcript_39034/g.54242 Transcript_39034/m.54242 type:complete len:310 (-) Transcript_39034:413-1342(-)
MQYVALLAFLLVYHGSNIVCVTASTPESRAARAAAATHSSTGVGALSEQQNTNLEQGIKMYMAAKGQLTPADLSTFSASTAAPKLTAHQLAKNAHKRKPAPKPAACVLQDGCVAIDAKTTFLKNKYIPGNDNILSPYFRDPGHMFEGTPAPAAVNLDFLYYMMSRPKQAVPDSVRQLLMPEGDAAWPGGEGGDRTAFYPKTLVPGAAYWESDIDEVKGDEKAKEEIQEEKEEKDEEKKEEEKEEAIVEEKNQETPMLDMMIWGLLIMAMLPVPIILYWVFQRSMAKPETKASFIMDPMPSRLRPYMRTV